MGKAADFTIENVWNGKESKIDNGKFSTTLAKEVNNNLKNEAEAIKEASIPLHLLCVSPYNKYAYTESELNMLVDNISSVGLLTKFLVEEKVAGKYPILSGQKRFLAINRIRENNHDLFEKLFPGGNIPCDVVDLSVLEFTDGIERSIDVKRRMLISSSNVHHEPTIRDYMLRYRDMEDFYSVAKKNGKIESGVKQRDYYKEQLGVNEKYIQAILNASKKLSSTLWKYLEGDENFSTFNQLKSILDMPEEKLAEMEEKYASKEAFNLNDFLSGKEVKPETPSSETEPRKKSGKRDVSKEEIMELTAMSDVKEVSKLMGTHRTFGETDLKKLAKCGDIIKKQLATIEKILQK